MLAQQALLGLIRGAFAAATAAELSGALVTRQRRRPIPEGSDRSICVRLVRAESAQAVVGPINWTTLFAVEYIARCGAALAPDEAVGPMVQAGHAVLMAADPALTAAGFDVMPTGTLVWDEDESEDRIGVCTAIYMARHRTAFNNLNA